MKLRACVIRAGLWLIAASAVALASVVLAADPQPPSWDTYRVLAERNMFLRDRYRPPAKRTEPTRPTPPPNPDRSIVLTGTAKCGDALIAFFEDSRAGKTIRAQVGQTVGTGKLTAITLDGVAYETGGKATTIRIGYRLTGEAAPVRETPRTVVATAKETPKQGDAKPPAAPPAGAPAMAPAAAPTPGSATAPATTQDSGMARILELMRQRREQELTR